MCNTPVEAITDVLVLAAIERAERHRQSREKDPPGVPAWAVLEHLAVARRSRRARRVRERLGALMADGSLQRSRRSGIAVWASTGKGRRCLARARRAGALPALPEAPQHVAWREAYAAADAAARRLRRRGRRSKTVTEWALRSIGAPVVVARYATDHLTLTQTPPALPDLPALAGELSKIVEAASVVYDDEGPTA